MERELEKLLRKPDPERAEKILNDLEPAVDEYTISAGELRAAGMEISPEIPDCAEASRFGIRLKEMISKPSPDPQMACGTLVFEAVPFKWVSVQLKAKTGYDENGNRIITEFLPPED